MERNKMTIQEKVIASKVPSATIAKGIGMLKGTFSNKMKGNNNSRFSIGEIEKIDKFLKDICKEINK